MCSGNFPTLSRPHVQHVSRCFLGQLFDIFQWHSGTNLRHFPLTIGDKCLKFAIDIWGHIFDIFHWHLGTIVRHFPITFGDTFSTCSIDIGVHMFDISQLYIGTLFDMFHWYLGYNFNRFGVDSGVIWDWFGSYLDVIWVDLGMIWGWFCDDVWNDFETGQKIRRVRSAKFRVGLWSNI